MTGVAHETNCSQRCGKRTFGGDFDRERFSVCVSVCVCVCVCMCVEELEVDERRVTEKEQDKNHVPTGSSPSLPAITNRKISTRSSLFPRGEQGQ